jgi:GNAT superfamily N-acetyltransferase/RimJ/RimL family protein N-acetyltransferase
MLAGQVSTTTLANGRTLTIRVVEPPLGDLADQIEYWWRDIRAPLLAGDLAATSLDRFVIGELDGAYVGSMTYATPRDTRDVAALEMVWTRADQRRQGIASALLRHTLADFLAGGGVAMYLCTVNPHAFAVYAQHGFQPLIGDGMRYLAPGQAAFDQTYFAPAGPATIRPGVWGDLARVSALYNQPQPDWLIKDYPRRVFRDMRYEGHYRQVWRPASLGRGTLLVLENPRRRLVGLASLVEVDSFWEQHVGTLDCFACPAYLAQLPELIAAVLDQARAGPLELVQAFIAAVDTTKGDLLTRCGFQVEARLPDRLRLDGQPVDLLLFSRRLRHPPGSRHPLGSYYGARPGA